MRLGCKDHDPALLRMMRVARFGAEPVPPRVATPQCAVMLGRNDSDPTCVPTAIANAGNLFRYRMGTGALLVPDSAILTLYANAIGEPGATEAQIAASDGCDPLSACQFAQACGWNVGEQVPIVPDFRPLAQQNRLGIAATVARLGSCPVPLTLYESDMEDFAAGRQWQSRPRGNPVGGHMPAIGAYAGFADTDTVEFATWGVWFPGTWDWLLPRLRLALAVAWRQFMPTADQAAYNALWGSA